MNALLLVAAALAVLFFAGFAFATLGQARERRRADQLADKLQETGVALAEARERLRLTEEQKNTTAEYLRAEAAQSANAVAEALVKRADESFRNREQLTQAKLEAQLKPVAETLAKFEAQVQAMEKGRAEETGGLKAQIEALMQASTATQAEARKLSAALRRGAGVQGRWGEQTLRNVLEVAGLVGRFDFTEQFSLEGEDGRLRPDVTVRLPGGASFVIDAKCSLNAFLESQDAADEAAREACLARHAASVRSHMTSLSAKAYWSQFDASPDFVAMFVPGDGFLAAAIDRLPDLMTEAMDKRVLLVTPTTLFALCKAVAYGWRGEEQARNADQVARLGKDLYKRLSVMGGHVGSLGKALEAAVGRYNSFVGSLESQVMSQARRFEDLAVDHEGADLPQLPSVEQGVRPLAKLATNLDAPQTASGRDEAPALTARGG